MVRLPINTLFAPLLLSALLLAPVLQQAQARDRFLTPLKIGDDEAPSVDGILDDSVWKNASRLGKFIQREPEEGDPASERTEILVLYDSTSLYFGIRCLDSRPDEIRATELRRDNSFENDDSISLLIDTFHDKRNAYLFKINPIGTKYDATITEEERNFNSDWDEIWWAEARITPFGWVGEIKIPFKSIRSPGHPLQTWGFNVERVIRRKNEFVYWSGHSRNWSFWNVSQAGELRDLQEVETGLKIRVKPYVLGGISQTPDPVSGGRMTENESDVGLEDVKIPLTSSITADLTANPDFAQTEVDEARVNLTRFNLFFPEKRDFFLEGSGIFRFGTPAPRFADIIPELLVFHSRRIGLRSNGEPVPILFGGKISGEEGGFQFGAVNAQVGSQDQMSGENAAAVRIKKGLFKRSYLGGIFTNRSVDENGHYNRVFGADANFVLFDKLTLSAVAAKSDTRNLLGDDLAWLAVARWTDHRFDVDLEHAELPPDFNPELGFVRRRGVTRDRFMFAWKPRPALPWIRQFYLATGHQWFESHRGFLESRDNDNLVIVDFESGDSAGVEILHDYEFFDEAFPIHPDVSIQPGSYRFTSASLFASAYSGRRVSGGISLRIGNFYDGDIFSTSLTPVVKMNRHLSFELEHGYNRVTLSNGSFDAQVFNSRVNYSFSNRWLTSTTFRYENITGEFLMNFRLNYIYRPGDDIFVVYNEGRGFDLDNGLISRSLLVKFNHSFDF